MSINNYKYKSEKQNLEQEGSSCSCGLTPLKDAEAKRACVRSSDWDSHSSLCCLVRICWRGFPGGAVVENLPANAGDTGSSPGLGRSHMPRSNWAREPQLLSLRVWPVLRNKRGRDSERPAHRDEEWPPLAATRESPCTETKTQRSHK